MGFGIQQAHAVGGPHVEDGARSVVPLVREQGTDGGADVSMEQAQKLARVGFGGRDAEVMVVDDADGVMDGHARVPLCISEGIEPALVDEFMPGTEEGLPQRSAPGEGGRSASNDDAGSGHDRRDPRIVPSGRCRDYGDLAPRWRRIGG